MDDTNQNAPANQTALPNQGLAKEQGDGVSQQAPASVISAPSNKEKNPSVVGAPPSEFITSSEPEPTVLPEVEKAGVEIIKDNLPITDEHTQAGIRPSGESVPPITTPSGIITLPRNLNEANQMIKSSKLKITDSFRWMLAVFQKLFKVEEHKMKETKEAA